MQIVLRYSLCVNARRTDAHIPRGGDEFPVELFFCDLDRRTVAQEAWLIELLVFHGDQFQKFVELLHGPILISFFAPPQTHDDFHGVPLGEKFFHLTDFYHEIVMRRLGGDLDRFHCRAFLREAFFLDPFLFLVAEFVITHQPYDGWGSIGGYLDEINTVVWAGKLERLGARHNAEIGAGLSDDAEFGGGDLVVDARLDYASIISAVVE